MNSNDIINMLTDIRTHFENNINNKYVKNIFIKIDLHPSNKQEMNIILVNDFHYIDSRGGLQDLYTGIKSVTLFIKEVINKVLKNLNAYVGTGLGSSASVSQNDKILAQMAIKNYPMNIKILNDKLLKLLDLLLEYDKQFYAKDPAYLSVKDIEQTRSELQSYSNTITN